MLLALSRIKTEPQGKFLHQVGRVDPQFSAARAEMSLICEFVRLIKPNRTADARPRRGEAARIITECQPGSFV